MSDHQSRELSERLVDLCADYALGLHEPSDVNELDRLDPDMGARGAFEAVAAELDIAFAETDPVDMPAGLEERLFAAVPAPGTIASPALRLTNDQPSTTRPSQQTHAQRGSWFPWLVAAASLAITGVVVFGPSGTAAPEQPIILTAEQQRDALIESHATDTDLLRYAWTPTEDPSVVGDVTGELIWDESLDEGYMTIGGLAVNDPSEYQYQLWIFDTTRRTGDLPQFDGTPFGALLTQRPIDGGVFDITEEGEVVIPIDPKLLVQQGIAFAVTVEPPGGVVVSDRTRVPLLAVPQG
jgi:anti-sigma-K factor RskA